MNFKVEVAVTLLLVASSILLQTAIVTGKAICPNNRQCGDIKCKPTEFCQVLFQTCPPPPKDLTTHGPYCPPILSCEKLQCPTEKPTTQLLCVQGYEVEMIKLPNCDHDIPTCHRINCGKD